MNFTVEGKIVRVFDKQSGTSQAGKAWEKQDFMIETAEEKPQQIVYTVFGSERLLSMDASVGDSVRLTFSIQAREWNGKWFTNINGESIEKLSVETKGAVKKSAKKAAQPILEDDGSDLPF